MWLLNVYTKKLQAFDNEREAHAKYAILSHTWGVGEVSFQDIMCGRGKEKPGYRKIILTCNQAIQDQLEYCWIDTCCIDKTSSAELSQAVNSMFRFYLNAKVCYAYLEDIPALFPCLDDRTWKGKYDMEELFAQLKSSRWFTRGWTLQELIAPKVVRFYGQHWNYIGSKASDSITSSQPWTRSYLRPLLSRITKIDQTVLEDSSELANVSVAKKMMWAADRNTTREEDRAYSLMGIFQVNMPLVYGEGRKAFIRLQEEIIKSTPDLSVFAWSPKSNPSNRLLTHSLAGFRQAGAVVPCTASAAPVSMELTNRNLRVKAPVLRRRTNGGSSTWIVLNCRYEDDFSGPLGAEILFHNPKLNAAETELDPNEFCESFFTLYNSPRLEVIPLAESRNAKMQNLLLTKEPKMLQQDTYIQLLPSFWIRYPKSGPNKLALVASDADSNWNHETGVMFPSWAHVGDEISSFISLETPSGRHFIVKFTFATTAGQWRIRSRNNTREGAHFHLLCFEPSVSGAQSMPPRFSPARTAELTLSSGEVVRVEVEKENIMGTLVFVMDVAVNPSSGHQQHPTNSEGVATLRLCSLPEDDEKPGGSYDSANSSLNDLTSRAELVFRADRSFDGTASTWSDVVRLIGKEQILFDESEMGHPSLS